jgi:predicted transcriptional regulator
MIDVLLSIRPNWCKKVLSGEKPVELRKSRPCTTEKTFQIYLYETKLGRGAIVGGCICWMVEKAEQRSCSVAMVEGSCLTIDQIATYAKNKPVYGWYLAKVTEYKTPRPLSDLGINRAPQSWCYIKEAA